MTVHEKEGWIETKNDKKQTPEKYGHIGSLLSSVFLTVAVCICLLVSVQVARNGYVNLFGYSCFRVITGSMEPTIPVGAVLISRETNILEIESGDIICYRTEVSEIHGSIVTHRVLEAGYDSNGNYALITKGDANASADPFLVRSTNLIGRVVWYSGAESAVTVILAVLSGKIGFLACVVIPILLLSTMVMQRCAKNLYSEIGEVRRTLKKEQEDNELLPGYSTLTRSDYEEIYESIKADLLKELLGNDLEKKQ